MVSLSWNQNPRFLKLTADDHTMLEISFLGWNSGHAFDINIRLVAATSRVCKVMTSSPGWRCCVASLLKVPYYDSLVVNVLGKGVPGTSLMNTIKTESSGERHLWGSELDNYGTACLDDFQRKRK